MPIAAKDISHFMGQSKTALRPEFEKQMSNLATQQVSRGFYGQMPGDVMQQKLATQQTASMMEHALGLQQTDFQRQAVKERLGLARDKFAEQKRQFGKTYDLQQDQFGFQQDKWAEQFGLQKDQFQHQVGMDEWQKGFSEDKFAFEQDRWTEQFGLREKELEHGISAGQKRDTLGSMGTGAGIGTMIAPGVGTAIGAGVGWLASKLF